MSKHIKRKNVPLEKQSKKRRKEYNDKQRNKWEIDPRTKVKGDKNSYRRKKQQEAEYDKYADYDLNFN